jgi:hypothetical protein
VANTLAYYDMATITAVKSFIVQAPSIPLRGKLQCFLLQYLKYTITILDRLSIFAYMLTSLPSLNKNTCASLHF